MPTGQPSSDQHNPDYVPSIFVCKKGNKSTRKSKVAQYKRYMNRRARACDIEESLEQDKAEHGPSNSQDSTNPDPLFKDSGINTDPPWLMKAHPVK